MDSQIAHLFAFLALSDLVGVLSDALLDLRTGELELGLPKQRRRLSHLEKLRKQSY